MSGVVAAMRRTLLSRTSLARYGMLGLAVTGLSPAEAAGAPEVPLVAAISTLFDFNRQELAVLATALALLGFSVVSAILLMHTRLRAAKSDARLRSKIADLQVRADRYRALLFASRKS
jgi:hypothetical protein